jgi:hypothetical protein
VAPLKLVQSSKVWNDSYIGILDELSLVNADFPWAELPKGTTVCDVGGGIGAITMQLAKEWPHLSLKLQDTPERIEQAQKEVWPKECPVALDEDRIQFKPMDFFVDPPIEGCDFYYVCFYLVSTPLISI